MRWYRRSGSVPEWPKGTGCKPVALPLRWFESNPAHRLPPRGRRLGVLYERRSHATVLPFDRASGPYERSSMSTAATQIHTVEIPTRSPRRFAPKLSAVDIVFGLTVAASAVAYFSLSRRAYFSSDDWHMALRGRSVSDFLEPYNGHLSVVPIAVYRTLYAVFGFETYVPWRLVAHLCLISVAVALFLVMRARTGPLLAAVAGSAILWFDTLRLSVPPFNHFLALVGAIVCAGQLDRVGRRADLIVAVALAFSFCSAGGGVPVAAACGVHTLLTRRDAKRWLAVLLPSCAWGVWWMANGSSEPVGPLFRYDAAEMLRATVEGVMASFDGLTLGNRAGGLVLAAAFVVHLAWRVRQGLANAANAMAWSAALILWWFGVVYTRQGLVDATTFRYQFVGSVFVLLALLPPAPLRFANRWTSWVAAAVLVSVASAGVLANYGEIAERAEGLGNTANRTRATLIATNLGTEVVPDEVRFDSAVGRRSAEEYRRVVSYYGTPEGTHPVSPDRETVRLLDIRPARVPIAESCRTPNEVLEAPPGSVVVVLAGSEPSRIALRRLGSEPVTIGTVASGKAARILLPGVSSPLPWSVTASGACLGVL
jgi:hypothetical protein